MDEEIEEIEEDVNHMSARWMKWRNITGVDCYTTICTHSIECWNIKK